MSRHIWTLQNKGQKLALVNMEMVDGSRLFDWTTISTRVTLANCFWPPREVIVALRRTHRS